MRYTTSTSIVNIDPTHPQADLLQLAAEVIQRDGLVAFPTETVYGLGANALSETAVKRIFSAKERPYHDPIIVHIADMDALHQLAINIPEKAWRLAYAFWPGALTLVLERAPHLPSILAQDMPTLAVRMPLHPVARELIRVAQVPIAAPSANRFTRPSATTAQHVVEDLFNHVDLILDGGNATIGIESTVIDMTQDPPIILRPGGIPLEDIHQVLSEVEWMLKNPNDEDQTPSKSPGMLSKHYSPRAEVLLFEGELSRVIEAMRLKSLALRQDHKSVGVLSTDEEAHFFIETGARVISMGSTHDLEQVAHVLFRAMRVLDNQHVEKILVRGYGQQGLGAAIWDRLLRSAEGKVIHIE
ncbi:MAG: L-threonylcarbamoyladenylate synthase [Phototrophicaceae bacterium]